MQFLADECAVLMAPAPVSVTHVWEGPALSVNWIRNQLSVRSVSQCERFLGVMVLTRGSCGDWAGW